jgi:hypothetical protein
LTFAGRLKNVSGVVAIPVRVRTTPSEHIARPPEYKPHGFNWLRYVPRAKFLVSYRMVPKLPS